jgi:hypothetical protein
VKVNVNVKEGQLTCDACSNLVVKLDRNSL